MVLYAVKATTVVMMGWVIMAAVMILLSAVSVVMVVMNQQDGIASIPRKTVQPSVVEGQQQQDQQHPLSSLTLSDSKGYK